MIIYIYMYVVRYMVVVKRMEEEKKGWDKPSGPFFQRSQRTNDNDGC